MIKFIILLLLGLGVWWRWSRPAALPPLPSPTPVLQTFANYQYAVWVAQNPQKLKLFSNLTDKDSSKNLMAKNNCQALINAGFYDEKDKHLGWFVSQGREISPAQTNRLFNGFLAINDAGASIDFEPRTAEWGLQSGPVLVYDAKPLKLAIKDDQPRRRVMAALTQDKQLMFLVILSAESDYAGPLLAETPKLLLAINPGITAAVNLDGGSASAFMTPEVNLTEYQPLGGYFCYTK